MITKYTFIKHEVYIPVNWAIFNFFLPASVLLFVTKLTRVRVYNLGTF